MCVGIGLVCVLCVHVFVFVCVRVCGCVCGCVGVPVRVWCVRSFTHQSSWIGAENRFPEIVNETTQQHRTQRLHARDQTDTHPLVTVTHAWWRTVVAHA